MSFQTIQEGGAVFILLVVNAALITAIILDRIVFYHRQYNNSDQFLSGVRTVLRRGNVVEALSICEATPGPVARLVKHAILNRSRTTQELEKLIYVNSLNEVQRLEEKLGMLGTLVKVAPLLGFWGVILGLMDVFQAYVALDGSIRPDQLVSGMWRALISAGFGIAISIPGRIGYEYLIQRLQNFIVEMEKCSAEITIILHESL